MNTVKVFAYGISEQIHQYLPEELQNMEFEVVQNVKNNGVILTGLCARVPGENISPVLYLNDFYDEVKNGASIEETMEAIAGCIENCRNDAMMSLDVGGHDIDMMQDKVTPMLINGKANRDMLQSVPHVQVEDLAMIFKVDLKMPGSSGIGTMKVKNEMLERWGISKEELYSRAISNVQKYDAPVLAPMSEMVFELSTGSDSDTNLLVNPERISDYENEAMFVLTNESRHHGTAALVCPEVMNKVHELIPEGFYILPSSIHETLIVSKDCEISPKHLGQMVREINHEMVDREDILSDRVYEYDKDLGKIRQVPESIQKSREASR